MFSKNNYYCLKEFDGDYIILSRIGVDASSLDNILVINLKKTIYISEIMLDNDKKKIQIHYTENCLNLKLIWVLIIEDDMELLDSIKNNLNAIDRAKNIAFIINSASGKNNSSYLFNKKLRPILDHYYIKYTEFEINNKSDNHTIIKNILKEPFDSIAIFGGDGTVSMVLTELNKQVDGECNTIISDNLKKWSIIIFPTGSTNSIFVSLNNMQSFSKAIMNLLIGSKLKVDVMSVHNDGNFIQIVIDAVSLGYLSNVVKVSEKMRNRYGTFRYLLSGMKNLQNIRSQNIKLEYTSYGTCNTCSMPTNCSKNCQQCSETNHSLSDHSYTSTTERFDNNFQVMVTSCSCKTSLSPNGFIPNAHLSDGSMFLTTISSTNIFSFIKTLYMISKGKLRPCKNVRLHKIKSVTVESDISCTWSLSGEIVEAKKLTINIHRQAVNVLHIYE